MTINVKRYFNQHTFIFFLLHGAFFAGNQFMLHQKVAEFDAGQTGLGLLIGSFCIGSMIMVLLLSEYSERLGKRRGAIAAAIMYSAGAIMLAVSPNMLFSIFACFIFGCGLGALEGIWFSLVGDYNGAETGKYINLDQALFSIGAVLSPLIIAWLVNFISYRYAYGFIGIVMLAYVILFITNKSIDEFAVKSTQGSGLAMFKLIKAPAVLILMIMLMVSAGSETAITYWLPSYFESLGAMELGAIGISAYWLASVPGRLLASRLKDHAGSLKYSFLLCAIGMAVILFAPTPVLKLIGILIAGIAMAPVYPNISTISGGMFPQNSASAFSLMVFSMGAGAFFAQPLISGVSQIVSITAVYSAIVVIMLALTLSSYFMYKKRK